MRKSEIYNLEWVNDNPEYNFITVKNNLPDPTLAL
jgi:hypothetical protein